VIAEQESLKQAALFPETMTGEFGNADVMPQAAHGYNAAGDLPSTWKTAGRGWGHPLHKLSPYVGRFPAALVRWFVLNLSDPGQTVFDPWSGGGTTPLESTLCDRNAVATDAFSYAYVLSHAKGNPMTYDTFDAYLQHKLTEAASVDNMDMRLLDNPDVRVSFSDHTLDQMLRLREIMRGDNTPEAIFLHAVMCGVLHGPSKMFLSAPQKDQTSSTTQYVRKWLAERGIVPPDRDIYQSCMRKAELCLEPSLPIRRAHILRGDCRRVPLADESVNLVVTSPPYLSVLNYPWNNWLRLWWLREDRAAESNALMQSGREPVYRQFMREAMGELWRVMTVNSAAVIVVGDVKQKGCILNSAELIAEEAVPHGFQVDRIIDDVYSLTGRSMLVHNMLKWGYQADEHAGRSSVLTDRCLVLVKGNIEWRAPRIDWAALKSARSYLIE